MEHMTVSLDAEDRGKYCCNASTAGRRRQVVGMMRAEHNAESVPGYGWDADMVRRAGDAAGGRGASDTADKGFGKASGCRKEDTGILFVYNSREEEAVLYAEAHLMVARAAEKMLHLLGIDDLPYRQEHLMVQRKTMLSVAYLAEAEE